MLPFIVVLIGSLLCLALLRFALGAAEDPARVRQRIDVVDSDEPTFI